MDFSQKVVVFVGGLGGIGFETCKLLLKKDIAYLIIWDVIENADSIEKLKSINPKCLIRYIKFDITDKASIKSALDETIAETKLIDILINGAGIHNENDMELTMKVNLIGLMQTTYEVLPYMDKQKFGRGGLIVNIASVAGLEPMGQFVTYSASKFGVVGFTRNMADSHYYDMTGVAATAVCPGMTLTPMVTQKISYTFDYGKDLYKRYKNIKFQTAETCAENFVRVIEENKNGSHWIIDGGIMKEVEFKVHWEM